MVETADTLLEFLDCGRVRDAVRWLREESGLKPFEATETTQQIVDAWGCMGAGDTAAAVAILRPLVANLEGGTQKRHHAHALLALGVACVMSGDSDAGMALLERSLSFHTMIWPRAQALRFLGLGLEQRAAWEGAAARYTAAAALYEEISHVYGTGSSRYGAAQAFWEMGKDEAARTHILAAVAVLRNQEGGGALSAALAMQATLMVEQDPALGLQLLEEAESLADPSMISQLDLATRRAEILLRVERSEEALIAAQKSLQFARPGSQEALACQHIKMKSLLQLGRFNEVSQLLEHTALQECSNALLMERLALRLINALAQAEDAQVEWLLSEMERRVRMNMRRGMAPLLEKAARQITDPERAVRVWKLSVMWGTPIAACQDALQSLRALGARIPLGSLWLETAIGKGGMGEVWQASHRDHPEGARVAVKILRGDRSGEHADLFEAEVQTIAALDHPNIVRVLAALRVDATAAVMLGRPIQSAALVMELVTGGALDAHLNGMQWPEVQAVLRDLLDALAHAHARGVLHLDIKPGNVLIDSSDGRRVPRLADFGLASLSRKTDRRIWGTPAYMAPEQAWGGLLGPATDLYAIGCLAWQMVCGQTLFVGDPQFQIEQHCHGALPAFTPIMPVPEGLEQWLHHLLAKHAENRYACAADAAWALENLGALGGYTAPIAASPPSISTFELHPWSTLRVGMISILPSQTRSSPSVLAPAPFQADWRSIERRRPMPFLEGIGEGLFEWRTGRLVGREHARDQLWQALAAVHATQEGQVRWVVGAEGLGRSALLRWLAETAHASGAARVFVGIGEESQDRPSLILIDDAEADTRVLSLHKTLVVLAVRRWPEGAKAEEVILLSPLSASEITEIVDDRLPLDQRLAARIAARAEGSPAFAVALLADLLRRDALEHGPEGFRLRDALALTLSEDMRGIWRSRLETMAPSGSPRRSSWEMAAVLGSVLDREDWKQSCACLGLDADETAFNLLEKEAWVERSEGLLRFRVPALHDALLAAAEASGRAKVWHSVAADILVKRSDYSYGRHLALAGRHAEALYPLRRAAAGAVNTTRLEECRDLLALWDYSADALGMAPDDPQRASPLVVRVHLALHSREDPYSILRQGLMLATGRDPQLECQLSYTLAWVLAQEGRHTEAIVEYHRAIAIAEQHAPEIVAVAQLGLAASLFAEGQNAMPLLHSIHLDPQQTELSLRLDACAGRGLLQLGKFEEARPFLLRAITAARGIVPEVEAEALGDLAEIQVQHGELEDCLRSWERAIAVLSATGSDKTLTASIRLSALYLRLNRPALARALITPIQQRYLHRLRPAIAAEMAQVEAALERMEDQTIA